MVAYQGVPGAYSEQAALKACPEWNHIPCESFELVFQALSQVHHIELPDLRKFRVHSLKPGTFMERTQPL